MGLTHIHIYIYIYYIWLNARTHGGDAVPIRICSNSAFIYFVGLVRSLDRRTLFFIAHTSPVQVVVRPVNLPRLPMAMLPGLALDNSVSVKLEDAPDATHPVVQAFKEQLDYLDLIKKCNTGGEAGDESQSTQAANGVHQILETAICTCPPMKTAEVNQCLTLMMTSPLDMTMRSRLIAVIHSSRPSTSPTGTSVNKAAANLRPAFKQYARFSKCANNFE